MSTHTSGLSLTEVLIVAATIIGGVSAANGLAAGAQRRFSRTIGRRSDFTRRLQRLGTGAQLAFFESVLGEPPAMRRSFEVQRPDWSQPHEEGQLPPSVTRKYLECFFVNSLCYVQTVSDADDTVMGFSITTRSRRFHPTLWFPTYPRTSFGDRLSVFMGLLRMAVHPQPPMTRVAWIGHAIRFDLPVGRRRRGGKRVELGRTTFVETGADIPRRIQAVHGNKHWSYAEAYWGGNPGYYQDVVFAASRVSPVARYPGGIETLAWEERPWIDADPPEWIRRARSIGVITTMAVIKMGFHLEDWPTFGPTVDQIRTLP